MRAPLRIPAPLLLLAAVVLLGAAAHRTNRELEARVIAAKPSGDVGPLPDGHALRVLSLGFDRLTADLFWLRTLYYMGDEERLRTGYPAASRLAELVTDIDPGFATVYVTMGGVISAMQGDPDAAIALLEKGILHLDYWKLHFLLGFQYFQERQDYAAAGRQMELAARAGGGPPYLPLLAARLYASAGDRLTAIALIQARLREEREPEMRKALEKRAWDLWITRDLASIDQAIARHRERTGKVPLRIEELVKSDALAPEPRDPRGGAYRIEAGHAATDLEHDSLELHVPYTPIKQQGPAREPSGADERAPAGEQP